VRKFLEAMEERVNDDDIGVQKFIPGETTRSNRSPWTQRSHARRIEFSKSQARNCSRWGPGMDGTLCQIIRPDSCV